MRRRANNDDTPGIDLDEDRIATAHPRAIGFLPGLDVLILFVAIVALDWSGLLPFQLLGLQPHPFWVPVLLAVVEYGVVPGLTTVAIGFALHWLLGWTEPAVEADYYDHVAQNLVNPVLWLLAVGALGAIRQRQQDRSEAFEAEAEQRRAQATLLAEHCRSLRQDVAALEHRVAVSGPANAARCIDLLHRLATASAEELEAVFREVLRQLLGAEDVEIVVFDQYESFFHVAMDDATAVQRLPRAACNLPAGILDSIRFDRRTLSCLRPADSQILAALRAATVVPIPAPAGTVIGAVVIREIDPDCLTPSGEAALSLGAILLGQHLSRARPTVLETEAAAIFNRLNVIQLHQAAGAAE